MIGGLARKGLERGHVAATVVADERSRVWAWAWIRVWAWIWAWVWAWVDVPPALKA